MFERELIEPMFLDRWTIVRTLVPQSVAEHTYLVAHYANDIAIYLGLPKELHLSLLQHCLWHDMDEQFTGDLPGPNKRGLLDAIGPEAKGRWDDRLRDWASRTFSSIRTRSGGKMPPDDALTVKLVAKVADWMEAAVRMATESQMGNKCGERHIIPNTVGAIETALILCEHVYGCKIDGDVVPIVNDKPGERVFWQLREKIEKCVHDAQFGQSVGPWITKEDEARTFHDACVDTTA